MTHAINLESIVKNFGSEGKIVGFANKYYTLWTYKITENAANHELSFDAYFVKNLGKKNRYEGRCPFEETLKGVELHINSFRTDTGLQLTPQQFKALKFSRGNDRGMVIAEYSSLANLIWKYNTRFVSRTITPERQAAELTNIANRAIELGAVNFDGVLYRPEDADVTSFSRNPMVGTKISDCYEDGILCWKYNHHAVNENRPEAIVNAEIENIKARAIELGAVEMNGCLYSVKQQEEPWFNDGKKLLEAIENNQPYTFKAERNLDEVGMYTTNFVNLAFYNRYYPATYYGPAYCLPLDKKGHGKRIKNVEICIINAEKVENVNGKPIYKVLDWDIVK